MKLNKIAFGLATGIFLGVAIFLVTNIRLLTGGTGVGLSLLSIICPGYSFSFLGSLVGLIWGFVYGFVYGWLFVFLYNLIVKTSSS